MNAFRLRCFDQNCDRISVQSSCSSTWVPERRHYKWQRAFKQDVYLRRDDLVVIKTRGENTIELTGLTAEDGHIIARSSRGPVTLLRVNVPVKIRIDDGEALTLQSEHIRYPTRGHRTDLTV